MIELYTEAYFMKEALKEAKKARMKDEIPVGAVVVSGNRIISRAHNQTESLQDVTAHAEMLAITAATQVIGAKYLPNCRLYVTLEPCMMCGGALYWSQLGKLIYGAAIRKGVLCGTEEKFCILKLKLLTESWRRSAVS